MGSEFSKSIDENKPLLKCVVAVIVHIRDALIEVLHDPLRGEIPSDPQTLYKFFEKQQDKIKKLEKKGVLKAHQIALLLPQNQRTFSSKWDITLICVVLISFSKLPPPTNGWSKPRDVGDFSVSAFVVVARNELRNRLNHGTAEDFNDQTIVGPFWVKIKQALKIFKYTKMDDFDNLETGKLDPAIFSSQIHVIMDGVDSESERERIISIAQKWLQDHNEKSKLQSIP